MWNLKNKTNNKYNKKERDSEMERKKLMVTSGKSRRGEG